MTEIGQGEAMNAVLDRLDALEGRLDRIEQAVGSVGAATAAATGGTPPAVTIGTPPAATAMTQPPPPTPGQMALPPPPASEEFLLAPPAPLGAAPPGPPTNAPDARKVTEFSHAEMLFRWMGVLLVVLAAAFLVAAAVDRGWIGPQVQWATGGLVGLALIGVSVRFFDQKRHQWSLALAHGGVAVLGLVVLGGAGPLDLYGSLVAQIMSVIVAGVAVVLGWAYGRASLAAVGAAIAIYLPMMVGDGDNVLAGAVWLVLVVAAALALAVVRGWQSLRLSTYLLSLPAIALLAGAGGSENDRTGVILALVLALGALFAFAVSKIRPGSDAEVVDQILHRLMAFFPALAWVPVAALWSWENDGWYVGIGAAVLTAVIAAGMHLTSLAKPTAIGGLVFGASAAAVFALVLGVMVEEFAWGWGLIAAVVVAAVAAWTGRLLDDDVVQGGVVLLGGACVAATYVGLMVSIADRFRLLDHAAYFIVLATLTAAALRWWDEQPRKPLLTAAWLGWLGWVAAVALEAPQGLLLTSVLWMVMGGTAFVMGLANENEFWTRVGYGTIVLTVAKLVLIDLSGVDTLWRALLFFVVGLGLLRLGIEVARRTRKTEEPPAAFPALAGVAPPTQPVVTTTALPVEPPTALPPAALPAEPPPTQPPFS